MHLPISGTLIAWAIGALLAVGIAVFAVLYYAIESGSAYDPTAEGVFRFPDDQLKR